MWDMDVCPNKIRKLDNISNINSEWNCLKLLSFIYMLFRHCKISISLFGKK